MARARNRLLWPNNPIDCCRVAEDSAVFNLVKFFHEFPILSPLAEALGGQVRGAVGGALRAWIGDPNRFVGSDDATVYATEIAIREAFVCALVCKPVRALLDELVGPDATDVHREDYRILHSLYRDGLSVTAIGRELRVRPDLAVSRINSAVVRWQDRVRVFAGTALGDAVFPLPEALR